MLSIYSIRHPHIQRTPDPNTHTPITNVSFTKDPKALEMIIERINEAVVNEVLKNVITAVSYKAAIKELFGERVSNETVTEHALESDVSDNDVVINPTDTTETEDEQPLHFLKIFSNANLKNLYQLKCRSFYPMQGISHEKIFQLQRTFRHRILILTRCLFTPLQNSIKKRKPFRDIYDCVKYMHCISMARPMCMPSYEQVPEDKITLYEDEIRRHPKYYLLCNEITLDIKERNYEYYKAIRNTERLLKSSSLQLEDSICESGAYGTVYKMINRSNKLFPVIAIKFPRTKASGHYWTELMNEHSILRRVSSLNHCATLLPFACSIPFSPPFTTEFIMGPSLENIIYHAQRQLSIPTKLFIMKELIEGFYEMTRAKVLHGDIKPDNIIFDPKTGRFIYIDFNLSFVLSEQNTCKRKWTIQNSYYRDPSVDLYLENYEPSVEKWSLGCIFFEILTKRLLFNFEDNNLRGDRLDFLLYLEKYLGQIPSSLLRRAKNQRLIAALTMNRGFTKEQKEQLIHREIPNTSLYFKFRPFLPRPDKKITDAMDGVADLISRLISYENKPATEEILSFFEQEPIASLIKEANLDEFLNCKPKEKKTKSLHLRFSPFLIF